MPNPESLPTFAQSESRRPVNPLVLIAAGIVLLSLMVVGMLVMHRPAPSPSTALLPLDTYAPSVKFENITLSEAGHGTGTKSIYVDGQVRNTGVKTITAVTVQVVFPAGDGSTAAVRTLPLSLVRTREPYVDLQPVAAAPLPPGAAADFRMIFEAIPQTWSQQPPAIRTTSTLLR